MSKKQQAEVILFPDYAKQPKGHKKWSGSIRQRFESYLQEQGLNLTHQREEILSILVNAEKHLDIDEVFTKVKKKDKSIGRATVFRTIRLLQECHLVSEVSSAEGRAKYEINAERPHHDHLICVECGSITEFQNEEMERFQDEAIKEHNFEALWHRHEIFGRCSDCQK